MKTYRQVLKEGKEILRQAALPEGEWDAWLLFSQAFGMDRKEYLLQQEKTADQAPLKVYEGYLQQRLSRCPTAYILKSQGFMGLEFQVDERVLIPRQDTETLVEEAIERLKGKRDLKILDLCTGSGCIGISLAHYLKGKGQVWATDISEEALQVAEKNAQINQTVVYWRQGDLFKALSEKEQGTFDMILSNPPYIAPEEYEMLEPEVTDYEPALALKAKDDGLEFYERIAREAARWLTPQGLIGLEIGYNQGEAVSALLKAEGFHQLVVRQDLNGLDRVVWAEKGTR